MEKLCVSSSHILQVELCEGILVNGDFRKDTCIYLIAFSLYIV